MARELGLGGTERQLAEIAMALDREQFEPHVGCFTDGGFRAKELREAGVPILELGVRSLVSPSAVEGARRMGAYLARHGIGLVHADRKSTRLNSSHLVISYAAFCLNKVVGEGVGPLQAGMTMPILAGIQTDFTS